MDLFLCNVRKGGAMPSGIAPYGIALVWRGFLVEFVDCFGVGAEDHAFFGFAEAVERLVSEAARVGIQNQD